MVDDGLRLIVNGVDPLKVFPVHFEASSRVYNKGGVNEEKRLSAA
jgi:hypothetical protein